MNKPIDNRILRIESIAGFPREDFIFPDITSIFEEQAGSIFDAVDSMYEYCNAFNPNVILCIESFGYAFGIPLAQKLKCNIALARKGDKLPRDKVSMGYDMCYQNNKIMEIHKSAINSNDRVIIVDDFLASGGTFVTAKKLTEQLGGLIVGACFFIEIPEFKARNNREIADVSLHTCHKIRLDEQSKTWMFY